MQTITLTDGGPAVSALGFGSNNFGHNPFGNFVEYEPCERVVRAALEHGYTLFDTADVYGLGESEEYLGRALGSGSRGRADRHEVRCRARDAGSSPVPHGSAQYMRWAIEGSLRRLRHRPRGPLQMHAPDPATPIAETLGALGELVDEGKVPVRRRRRLLARAARGGRRGGARGRPARSGFGDDLLQLLTRRYEPDVIDACIRLGIRVHPWFVLESGC